MDGKPGTETRGTQVRETEIRETEIREVDPGNIDSVNIMCTMPGSDPREVLRESAQIHQRVATLGAATRNGSLSSRNLDRNLDR